MTKNWYWSCITCVKLYSLARYGVKKKLCMYRGQAVGISLRRLNTIAPLPNTVDAWNHSHVDNNNSINNTDIHTHLWTETNRNVYVPGVKYMILTVGMPVNLRWGGSNTEFALHFCNLILLLQFAEKVEFSFGNIVLLSHHLAI